MRDDTLKRPVAPARRSRRWTRWGALLAIGAAVAFVGVPALAGMPARLVEGCGEWIAAALVFELLSVMGFVVFFKLVFARPLPWRGSAPAGLRALGATTILPAGGLIGPTVGAWSAGAERPPLAQLTRATVTFAILTSAPPVIGLAAVGSLAWVGVFDGPHEAALTLRPAALAVGLLAAVWLAGRASRRVASRRHRSRLALALATPARALSDAVTDAEALVSGGDWKLVGSLAYSAFDFAVLWAAFQAYGHTPPLVVVAMGYLIGSLAGALPMPAGLGAVDGGLIGALVLYGAPVAPAAAAVLLYRGITLSLPVALGAIGCIASPATPAVGPERSRRCSVASVLARRRAVAELVAAPVES